jgi:hypothetical protein
LNGYTRGAKREHRSRVSIFRIDSYHCNSFRVPFECWLPSVVATNHNGPAGFIAEFRRAMPLLLVTTRKSMITSFRTRRTPPVPH